MHWTCCGGLKTLRGTPPQHPFDVDLWALSQVSKRLSTKYLEALKPILKKIFVCEVRFWDAVLVDVVPMGGSQIFKKISVCEVRFWNGFGLEADF